MYGMLFWHAALLLACSTASLYNCTLPGDSLASVLKKKDWEFIIEEEEDELPCVDHDPLNEGAVVKIECRKNMRNITVSHVENLLGTPIWF